MPCQEACTASTRVGRHKRGLRVDVIIVLKAGSPYTALASDREQSCVTELPPLLAGKCSLGRGQPIPFLGGLLLCFFLSRNHTIILQHASRPIACRVGFLLFPFDMAIIQSRFRLKISRFQANSKLGNRILFGQAQIFWYRSAFFQSLKIFVCL